VSTRIPLYEVWINDDANEFAVRLSGQPEPVLRTSDKTQYTNVIYAAPYTCNKLGSLEKMVDEFIKDNEKRQ